MTFESWHLEPNCVAQDTCHALLTTMHISTHVKKNNTACTLHMCVVMNFELY